MNFKAQSEFKPVDLSRIMAQIVPKLVTAVTESCEAVSTEAAAIAPVETGALRESIHVGTVELVGTVVEGTVGSSLSYAAFVEYGTGKSGEGTYPGELPQSGVPFTGSWVYDFRKRGWIGHAARPYLRPALDTARPAIQAAFERQGFKR